MERLSKYQLFVITNFFQIGTTVILGFGSSAGKDAWLVSLLSTLLGLAMIGVYLVIYHFNPGLTLVEWFPAQFGKWIGTPIAWLYPLLFLYETGRILNDIKFLVASSILPSTPSIVIITLFILLVTYGLFCGIEVLGRIGELLFPSLLVLFLLENIFLLLGGAVNIKNLLPVLDNGIGAVLTATWSLGASQGFAQTLELAMLWTLVGSSKDTAKVTISSTLLSGLIITVSNILAISALGELFFKNQNFPLYVVIQKITIGDLIKHLDVIGVIYFMITSFFKISLHMHLAIKSIQKLTHLKNERRLIMPLSVLAIYLGYYGATNMTEHIEVGLKVFPFNLWIALLWVIPILLLIVTLIHHLFQKTTGC